MKTPRGASKTSSTECEPDGTQTLVLHKRIACIVVLSNYKQETHVTENKSPS